MAQGADALVHMPAALLSTIWLWPERGCFTNPSWTTQQLSVLCACRSPSNSTKGTLAAFCISGNYVIIFVEIPLILALCNRGRHVSLEKDRWKSQTCAVSNAMILRLRSKSKLSHWSDLVTTSSKPVHANTPIIARVEMTTEFVNTASPYQAAKHTKIWAKHLVSLNCRYFLLDKNK